MLTNGKIGKMWCELFTTICHRNIAKRFRLIRTSTGTDSNRRYLPVLCIFPLVPHLFVALKCTATDWATIVRFPAGLLSTSPHSDPSIRPHTRILVHNEYREFSAGGEKLNAQIQWVKRRRAWNARDVIVTEQANEEIRLYTCIPEMSGSNLGRHTLSWV
jgi:hypothetical protein